MFSSFNIKSSCKPCVGLIIFKIRTGLAMETAFTKHNHVMECVQITQINVEQCVLVETVRTQLTTEAVGMNVSTSTINAKGNVHKDTPPVETIDV